MGPCLGCNPLSFLNCSVHASDIPGPLSVFQVAAALGGGVSQVLATFLQDQTGGTAGVSLLLIGIAFMTLIATLFALETEHDRL